MGEHPRGNVALAGGRPASEILHDALREGLRRNGESPAAFHLPEGTGEFRHAYPAVLPAFEAARRVSAKRRELARSIVAALQRELVWQTDGEAHPLADLLRHTPEPAALQIHRFGSSSGWYPSLDYRGRTWHPQELGALGAELASRQVITGAAATALGWVAGHLLDQGRIGFGRLGARKIAMLGAGAEMAPTEAWLKAGADVLWFDTTPPPGHWFDAQDFSGRLYFPGQPGDLLTRPREALAALLAFSDGQPVDIGLYAYAPGQALEMRLTGVMNALVEALPRELVRSVTMLVSPTTPMALDADDVAAMATRRRTRPVWESLLCRAGLLSREDGCHHLDGVAVSRTVVAIQGVSYQAAQYVGKVLAAECWADAPDGRFRVSANTAAITRTRSLEHPVFAAAFGGASAFGVETLEPEQSRGLNGLLALHDWLHPQAPVPGAVRVHGGIHTLPYPLESALRIAAGIGFMRSPRLLAGLMRR
jgi:hypothetical protein